VGPRFSGAEQIAASTLAFERGSREDDWGKSAATSEKAEVAQEFVGGNAIHDKIQDEFWNYKEAVEIRFRRAL
jgi:hypothetical protein